MRAFGYAINGGKVPQRIHRQFALCPPITQCFHCHVQTDFVAVLEAVGHGLGGVEDRHLHATNIEPFDAFGQVRGLHRADPGGATIVVSSNR